MGDERHSQMTVAHVTGDSVAGDKVTGDKITAGNVQATNVAIGRGAQVIVNQIQEVLSAIDEMEKGIQAAERRLAVAISAKLARYTTLDADLDVAPADGRRNPYKALLDYKLEDAPYFYGRAEAIAAMMERMRQGRLTVLHSDSGSGKTSLLQAGLASRLLAEGHFPLYLRPYRTPPGRAVKRAFLSDYATRPELARFHNEQMSLKGFLERVTLYLGDRRVYVFLDQFEEFFVELDVEAQQTFSAQLRDCVESDLPVRWVLALRKEYFSDLRVFRALKPYDNEYFLPTFNLEEAQEVVTAPAGLKGVAYEDGLVDDILADLHQEGEGISPAQVQLVCYTLFEEKAPDTPVITRRLYQQRRGRGEGRPGAEGILTSHLTRVLERELSGRERQLARGVLHTLVTSQKRRAQRSRRAILNELQSVGDKAAVDESALDHVLQTLDNSRLVRVEEGDQDELRYELAHEYLLNEIEVDPQIQAVKVAQEILDQEVSYYRNHGVLLAKDKYDIVNSQRENLHLEESSRELLDKSEEQFEAEQARELRQAQALAEQREEARRQAVRVNRRNLALLGLVSTVAAALIIYYLVIPSFMRWAAANDEYAETVLVELDDGRAFRMEAYEVTNERYARCVDWGPCNRPNGFQDLRKNGSITRLLTVLNSDTELLWEQIDPTWKANRLLPVVNIDANDAMAFCQWIKRTLPTAEQWAFVTPPVATWSTMPETQALLKPEDAPEPDNRNGLDHRLVGKRTVPQWPPNATIGDQGIFDLVGSVSEWTRTYVSEYGSGATCTDTAEINSDQWLPVLGQSFETKASKAGNSYDEAGEAAVAATVRLETIGFRCVEQSYPITSPYSCPILTIIETEG